MLGASVVQGGVMGGDLGAGLSHRDVPFKGGGEAAQGWGQGGGGGYGVENSAGGAAGAAAEAPPGRGDLDLGGHDLSKQRRPVGTIGWVRRKATQALARWLWLTRDGRKLIVFITMNVVYFTVELAMGLYTARIGLISDAFHLSFGCCVLTVSLYAIAHSRSPPDALFSYGYCRMEVIAGFTNACFLLFMAFSLLVEALHSVIEENPQHPPYLLGSAVTNCSINLIGVVFFRRYARATVAYRCAQDMNLHGIFLHMVSDSMRSGCVILATWLRYGAGVGHHAEAVTNLGCAVAITALVMPLFRSTSRVLLQSTPEEVHVAALERCLREALAVRGVLDCSDARFWSLAPGILVGTLWLKIDTSADDAVVLRMVRGAYESRLGNVNLTVQLERGASS